MSKSKVTVTKIENSNIETTYIVMCGHEQYGFISYEEAEAKAKYLAGFNDNPIFILRNVRVSVAIVQGGK